MKTEDLPAPLSWWREGATGLPVVVVRASAREVVTRPPLGVPCCRSGPPLLAECNRVVPFSAWEPGAFRARFLPTDRPVDALPAGAA